VVGSGLSWPLVADCFLLLLYKKHGSFRNSARCLDYTGVRCLRMTLRIAFRSASFPLELLRRDPSTALGISARRLGRSPQQAKTGLAGDPDGRRENASAQGPSTSLRISPAGSDARKTAQLYKKQASIRKSVNGLDFRGVRCLRIVYGLVSIRKPRTPRKRLSTRSFDFAQDFACGFPFG